MPETVVVDANPEAAEKVAHEGGRAVGEAEAHTERADEARQQAEAAAAVAAEAAERNAQAVGEAGEHAADAHEAAAEAGEARDRVAEALEAQTVAINALVAELRESRQPATPPVAHPPKKPSSDRPPTAQKKEPLYYRKIGRRR
jgi:hypothetical protein